MTILEKYNRYLNEPTLSDEFREELEKMTEDEINDAFYRDLEFGTAGLRGILGPGSNRLNIYVIRKATVGFARFLLSKYGSKAKTNGVVIAHDNRLYSTEFSVEAARTLSSYGIKAYLFDSLRPTPELSYAVRKSKAVGGIMITASHNPKEYNGYKVYDKTGCQLVPADIMGLIDIIEHLGFELNVKRGKDPSPGQIVMLDESFDASYRKMVRSIQINKSLPKDDFKIVFSPQHGTAFENGMALFKHLKYNVVPVKEQCSPDPYFSNTKSPNPEEKVAYELPLEYARRVDADLIMVTDPDGDRIGIAFKNSKGEFQLYTGNETGALLINYILSQKQLYGKLEPNSLILDSIVTSSLGAKIANSYGVANEETLTGFKFIGNRIHYYSKTKEKTFVFGYEESYGYLIGTFVRDKDSLQALVMIAEMTNYYRLQHKTLDIVMEEIYQKFGYHKTALYSIFFKGQSGAKTMSHIMSNLHDGLLKELAGNKIAVTEDYLYLSRTYANGDEEFIENLPSSDAIKYFFEDGSWLAIRPSGTEPKCKFYYEALSNESLEDATKKIEAMHKDLLEQLKVEK